MAQLKATTINGSLSVKGAFAIQDGDTDLLWALPGSKLLVCDNFSVSNLKSISFKTSPWELKTTDGKSGTRLKIAAAPNYITNAVAQLSPLMEPLSYHCGDDYTVTPSTTYYFADYNSTQMMFLGSSFTYYAGPHAPIMAFLIVPYGGVDIVVSRRRRTAVTSWQEKFKCHLASVGIFNIAVTIATEDLGDSYDITSTVTGLIGTGSTAKFRDYGSTSMAYSGGMETDPDTYVKLQISGAHHIIRIG